VFFISLTAGSNGILKMEIEHLHLTNAMPKTKEKIELTKFLQIKNPGSDKPAGVLLLR
jgi:hypothetical protein